MPQINQLADAAYSQFFWLLLVLALIYFGIGRMMLPKIQSTVDARDQRIAGDLAAAQAARDAADETEAAYRARMDASRGRGAEGRPGRQGVERQGDRGADAGGQRGDRGEGRGRRGADPRRHRRGPGRDRERRRRGGAEMVERLAGVSVDSDEAARAVRKAAMTHG